MEHFDNIYIPEYFLEEGITEAQWTNWRWQLAHAARSPQQLHEFYNLFAKEQEVITSVIHNQYQNGRDEMLITPHVVSLINPQDDHDPIRLQHIPDVVEIQDDQFLYEKVWEKDSDFLDGSNRMVQQKYPDIAVLRITNTCLSFCRFCFEKERTLRRGVKTISGPDQFNHAVELIRNDPCIRQILISGGDPLIIPDTILEQRLRLLLSIPHINCLRIGTRSLLHNPYRITHDFASMLESLQHKFFTGEQTSSKYISIGTHFNHLNELSSQSVTALRRLQHAGISVYNQTVLLKGINDSVGVLSQLFERLLRENVRLHYLFHAMPVPRTGHFRTSVRKGQELMRALRQLRQFRSQLPEFVIPHETGKQIAEYMHDEFFEDRITISGKQYPMIKFKSDITGTWEEYIDGSGT